MTAAAADVTVLIPTIPVRSAFLERALASVAAQTLMPSILVQTDWDHDGSAVTRNKALARIDTPWTLCLDDDDVLMPWAVQVLTEAQEATGADVVSGGAWIPQRPDHAEPGPVPAPGWIDPETVTARSVLTVTSLVRTDLAQSCGGFEFKADPSNGMRLDDFGFYTRLAAHGAKFYRVPETIFIWNVHGKNTSGRPDRW